VQRFAPKLMRSLERAIAFCQSTLSYGRAQEAAPDRRMMLIAVLTTLNQEELLEVQVNAVLQNEELTREELREMAIFLTHYVGFPLGSKLDGVIKRITAKRKKAAAEGAANDKKANVNDAVKMHTGTVPE